MKKVSIPAVADLMLRAAPDPWAAQPCPEEDCELDAGDTYSQGVGEAAQALSEAAGHLIAWASERAGSDEPDQVTPELVGMLAGVMTEIIESAPAEGTFVFSREHIALFGAVALAAVGAGWVQDIVNAEATN